METFEINITGDVLTVHPLEDGTFDVYQDGMLLGNLSPSIDEETGGVNWESADLIAPDYVKQIGELIEEHEM